MRVTLAFFNMVETWGNGKMFCIGPALSKSCCFFGGMRLCLHCLTLVPRMQQGGLCQLGVGSLRSDWSTFSDVPEEAALVCPVTCAPGHL